MIPLKWIEKLYQLKKDNNIVIQFYGDTDQCDPVDVRYINYMDKKVFRWMCDYNLMTKEYVEGCGRYEKKLYDVLQYLKKYRRLPVSLSKLKIRQDLKVNICKTNKIRARVNKACGEKYFVGQKVIANKNFKGKGVFNSRFYFIQSIENDKVSLAHELNGKPISGKRGVYYFNMKDIDPAYCVTCYKYQGDTVGEEYNIHEVGQMSFNELYTSLSRGRSLSQIHFNYTVKKFYSRKEENNPTVLMPIKMSKGEIYECYNQNQNLY